MRNVIWALLLLPMAVQSQGVNVTQSTAKVIDPAAEPLGGDTAVPAKSLLLPQFSAVVRALEETDLNVETASDVSPTSLLGDAPLVLAELQDDLNARWGGAWVIVTGEIYSSCKGYTTDNRINGELVSSNGRFAFPPGELARVTRVDARRRRVDVFLDIYETVLIDYRDGPFTLYREATCPVELMLEFGGTRTRDLGTAGVEEQLDRWLERYARLEDAENSPNWNGRIREDYPQDYQLTLAAYEEWRMERLQHSVLESAGRQPERMSPPSPDLEPDYPIRFRFPKIDLD